MLLDALAHMAIIYLCVGISILALKLIDKIK